MGHKGARRVRRNGRVGHAELTSENPDPPEIGVQTSSPSRKGWVGGLLIFVNDDQGYKCQGTGLGEQKG